MCEGWRQDKSDRSSSSNEPLGTARSAANSQLDISYECRGIWASRSWSRIENLNFTLVVCLRGANMQGEQVSEMSLPAEGVTVFAGFHPGLFGPSTLPAPHLAVRAWGTAPTTNDPKPFPAPGQAESSSGEVVYGSSQLHAAGRFPNLPLCQLSTSLSNKDNGTRISEALGGEGEEEEEEETRVGCQGEWGHARGWRPWGMQRPLLPAL